MDTRTGCHRHPASGSLPTRASRCRCPGNTWSNSGSNTMEFQPCRHRRLPPSSLRSRSWPPLPSRDSKGYAGSPGTCKSATQLTGLAVGADHTTHPIFRAAVADEYLAVRHAWRAGDGVVRDRSVLVSPSIAATPDCRHCDPAAVERSHVDPPWCTATPRLITSQQVRRPHSPRFRVVRPHHLTAIGRQGVHSLRRR